jgi:YD repeat-containing protein
MLACTLVTLGACAVDPVAPDEPPMPSARRTSGEMADAEFASAPACLTRYRYPALGVTFDCRTALVGGDPQHFVTTCPVPVTPETQWHPPDRDEVELDARGHVVHELTTFQVPLGGGIGHPVEDTVNVYDAAGELQERTVTDGAGTVYSHSTVVDRDAARQPLHVSITVQPLTINRTYPATAQTTGTYGYDHLGRLNKVQFVYPTIGFRYYDRTITYDERARRRSYMTIVDMSGVSPDLGGPAANPAYDLLDAEGRVLEYGALRDPGGAFVDYRYDPQGRLVSEVHSGHTEALAINYVYDCR